MVKGSSGTSFVGRRVRSQVGSPLTKSRKSRHRRVEVEGLETRTLLATIPAVAPTQVNGTPDSPVPLTGMTSVTTQGDANSPTVAVDPYDAQKVFSVWGIDLSQITPAVSPPTAVIEGEFSGDGGTTWTSASGLGAPMLDPATAASTTPEPYLQITDPSVAWDAQGNVYVLYMESSGPTDGALVLERYNFSGSTATQTIANQIIYQWVSDSDAITSPTLAVDAGTHPTSVTTLPADVPNDPYANDVYIAWASIDQVPVGGYINFTPDRAELVVGTPIASPSGNEETLAFSGVQTMNAGGNTGPQVDTHPQLVISTANSSNPGQITIAWEDSGTYSTLSPPLTQLVTNIANPGNAYGFDGPGLPASIPAAVKPPATQGNWTTPVKGNGIYPAGSSTSTIPADPSAIAVPSAASALSTDVNGDGLNDIVVADKYPTQPSGQLGVLENSPSVNGTFPATTIAPAQQEPDGVVLAPLYSHTNSTTVLDAAVANLSGGETTLINGTLAVGGSGVFAAGKTFNYPSGSDTVAVAAISLGNGVGVALNDLVTLDTSTNVVTILDPLGNGGLGSVLFQFTAADGLNNPVAVAVGNFGGTGSASIAVLNKGTGADDSSVKVFLNTSGAAGASFNVGIPVTPLGANAVSMAAGSLTGNANPLNDLAVVTNSPGANSLLVLRNTSTPGGATVSFALSTVANSVIPGTPVGGQQGVAIGRLSSGGTPATFQDIAVLYGLGGPNGESMVAVFQNQDTANAAVFVRTASPTSTNNPPDFDAGQKVPTAIALMNLSNNSAEPWNDIVVTNNDNDDRTQWAGTVSVLQPAPAPSGSVITGKLAQTVNVSVPNTALINDLTVTVAINDTQAPVSNLSLVLIAPNNAGQITLVLNQINAAGTTNTGVGLPSGSGIGVYNGLTIGTVFDDNATRDIFDPTTTGTNGNTAAGTNYVGFFRPETPFGVTLASFVKGLGANINGTWTLFIQNYSATTTGATTLNEFSLQFSTGLTQPSFPTVAANQFDYVYGTNTSAFLTDVVGGSLTDTYPTAAFTDPQGVGPGMVMAVDNTLGPYSPYGADVGGSSGRTFGRIYMAFVGYFVVTVNGVTNPTQNTDIFLIYSDDGGMSWSAPELVNDDQGTSDGESGANDSLTPNANNIVTGRTQFQPEIAVDQSTGTLVMSWRDARDDAADARVATYITTSIDGGQTFGPQTYANPPKQAVDAITGAVNDIGPASDDESVAQWADRRPVRLRQPDGPGRLQWSGLPDLGRQLLRSQLPVDPQLQRQLLQRHGRRRVSRSTSGTSR